MRSLVGILILVSGFTAYAGTSKVGNGDEGRDLESLSEITSGKIYETRKLALRRLKRLNVQGIPGLGLLIPELKNTRLLMAKQNVRPMSYENGWETSNDGSRVYARTFAEPYSPTRFFPLAKSLGKEQLIALHTHEALHRALPANIRENEDKVSMLTLALTSPAATFDRVNRVMRQVLENKGQKPNRNLAFEKKAKLTSASSMNFDFQEQENFATASSISVAFSNYSNGIGFDGETWIDNRRESLSVLSLGYAFSPFDQVSLYGVEFEPRVDLSTTVLGTTFDNSGLQGPSTIMSRAVIYGGKYDYGPFVRLSFKGADDQGVPVTATRDVSSFGFFLNKETASSDTLVDLSYTLPSQSSVGIFDTSDSSIIDAQKDRDVGAIWSIRAQSKYNFRKFRFGFNASFDHQRKANVVDSTSMFRLGPIVDYRRGRYTLGISGLYNLFPGTNTGADRFEDIIGHGMGNEQLSFNMIVDI